MDEENSRLNNAMQLTRDEYAFLWSMVFNKTDHPCVQASRKAYADLQRTIRYGDTEQATRDALKRSVEKLIRSAIEDASIRTPAAQAIYDAWHRTLCESIQKAYAEQGIVFHIGQSQKWVNMAMKYLCLMDNPTVRLLYPFLHVPIDTVIYQTAEEELGVPRLKQYWSRIDEYDAYLDYQNKIRRALSVAPIQWEFAAWNRKS